MSVEVILLVVVLIAGFYMAWNIGANDVANAIGTSVGSGALTLRNAVIMAAIMEFLGAFFFGAHVSETVQKGIVDPSIFQNEPYILVYGMLAALLAAGIWLQVASYFGWPVSTTHSIVGAIVGFGGVVGGLQAIYWDKVTFIASSWLLSPIAGGIASYHIFNLLRKRIFYSFHPVEVAKRMAPVLGFFLITALTLIVISNGGPGDLSGKQMVLSSLLFGSCGSLIIYLCVRQITVENSTPKSQETYGPEIAIGLDKAKKHLSRVKLATVGEMNYHVSVLLEEVDGLSSSLKQNIEKEVSATEYDAVEKIFARLQWFSAMMMAFAHGANDVANAIGPLAAAVNVLTTGSQTVQESIPTWALALGGSGIIIGLATWGWRVVDTIGKKITELTPTRGFAAEFGAATTILIASRMGMPVSTTHTLVGAVIGVGIARGIGALNMSTMRDIAVSWVVTVPAGAIITIGLFYIIQSIFGAIV